MTKSRYEYAVARMTSFSAPESRIEHKPRTRGNRGQVSQNKNKYKSCNGPAVISVTKKERGEGSG
jgi:hypothetical protein